ncbi:MAG: hypothetical protein H6607_11645 [Flavobacteriales bacterium]|nr:hypothetical protein [Flavobacteriales bacterium]
MNRFNKMYWGLIIGFIAPLIVLYILFSQTGMLENWHDFSAFTYNLKATGTLILPSILVNFLFAIPYNNKPRIKFLRGIIVITLIYAIFAVISYASL